MNQFEKINHFEYESSYTSPNTLTTQEFHDMPNIGTDAKFTKLDYYLAHIFNKSTIRLFSYLQIENPFTYEEEGNLEIISFTLAYHEEKYYLVTLNILGILKLTLINYDLQLIKINEFKLFEENILFSESQIKLSAINQLGIIIVQDNILTLMDFKTQTKICQQLQNKIVSVQRCVTQNVLFILTEDDKLIIANQTTLVHINEHSVKYTENNQIQIVIYENYNQLHLFTITNTRRIMFWTFTDSDMTKSILKPIQSIKLKNKDSKQKPPLIDFQIDTIQNLLFICYQQTNQVQVYLALININHLKTTEPFNEKSVFALIKEIFLESPCSTFFHQVTVPENFVQKFISGTIFSTEQEYLLFQKSFKELQNDPQLIISEDCFYNYIFIVKTANEMTEQIHWFWYFADQLFYNEGGEIKLLASNSLLYQGSKTIMKSSLPNFFDNLFSGKVIPQPQFKQEVPQIDQSIDPVAKAAEILEKDLIPRIQNQNQLYEICNDVRNELSEDYQFMFTIKDLIEDQIKRELDKPNQSNLQDHQQIQKLENQMKTDLASLETQMESIINQNLDMYTQTCESFIMDNFNASYFSSLIEDQIQANVRNTINQQFQQQDSQQKLQIATKEYFQNELTPLYQNELLRMSQSIASIFDKIAQYFNEINYSEQLKQNNLNLIIDNANQQLLTINKNITQLIENYKPDNSIQQKLEQVIAQTEKLVQQYESHKSQSSQQQQQFQQPQSQQQSQQYSQVVYQQQSQQQQQQQQQQEQQQQQQQQQSSQISQNIPQIQDQRIQKIEDHLNQLRNDMYQILGQNSHQKNNQNEVFLKQMTTQLTQMQIKLTQPQISVSQLQEVMQQLILQFQFFILKAEQT